ASSGKRRPKEQPLDELDDAFAVELLPRAPLDGVTLVQGGAHQIVEQLGVDGGIKWRELSLGNEAPEGGGQGARDLILDGAQARDLRRGLSLYLEGVHKAQVLAGVAEGRVDDGARDLLERQSEDLRRLEDLRHLGLQRQADIQQDVVLVLEVQIYRA